MRAEGCAAREGGRLAASGGGGAGGAACATAAGAAAAAALAEHRRHGCEEADAAERRPGDVRLRLEAAYP
ncbi:MAG: hypothetical protein ACKOGH_05605, partial [Alphaproteobacteria bacterium]